MVEREFRLAAEMMNKGVAKCLDGVRKPYGEWMMHEAMMMVSILKAEATGSGGFSFVVSETKMREWRERVAPFLLI